MAPPMSPNPTHHQITSVIAVTDGVPARDATARSAARKSWVRLMRTRRSSFSRVRAVSNFSPIPSCQRQILPANNEPQIRNRDDIAISGASDPCNPYRSLGTQFRHNPMEITTETFPQLRARLISSVEYKLKGLALEHHSADDLKVVIPDPV
jgi:hypothetical protein